MESPKASSVLGVPSPARTPLPETSTVSYGPPLVLAAAIPEQVMVVHPATVVADMLASRYTPLIHSQQPAATPDPALEKTTS